MGQNAFLTTPPGQEPVSVAECKAQMRLEIPDDDGLIGDVFIPAARQAVENEIGRQLISASWRANFDRFPTFRRSYFHSGFLEQTHLVPHRPKPLFLPFPPLQSVVAVTYFDRDGVLQTLDPATYYVQPESFEGAIVLNPSPTMSVFWPDVQEDFPSAVRVDYIAGYGLDPSDVPMPLRLAIKHLVAHFYANREATTVMQAAAGQNVAVLPLSVDLLLGPYRALSIG